MTDYRTLLADVVPMHPKAVLATRIPWLCPDCEGSDHRPADVSEMSGSALNDGGYACSKFHAPCDHPNAPTIADLLDRMTSLLTNDDWILTLERDVFADPTDPLAAAYRAGRNNLIAEIRQVGPWSPKRTEADR